MRVSSAGLCLSVIAPALWAETLVQLPLPTAQRDERGSVTLSAGSSEGPILYTLDGKDPGAKSNPYMAPIALPSGGVVKSRHFSPDRKSMSPVQTASYEPLAGMTTQPSTVVAVTQDRSWPSYDWRQRHQLTSAAAKRQQPRILFIGDSITHFFGGEQFDKYPLSGKEIWDEFYGPRQPSNLGFGWDKTENVLWRLQHGAVDGISPKLVVMMIGTNNVGDCSAADIATGITAITVELNQRLPEAKILLLGVFPRGEKPNPQREKIAEINRLIAPLDGQRGITYLDIGSKFLSPEGLIAKQIMPDFLHPNRHGYRIWAEAIEPTVRRLLGESAKEKS
jgi:lysophospholipase L1-like esterase